MDPGEAASLDACMRAAFEAAAEGLVVAAVDGRILWANAALEAVTGHGARDVVGRALAEVTHPEDVAAGVAIIADVVERRVPRHRVERQRFLRDGVAVWARLTIAVPPGISPPMIVARFEDLSETRQLAHALGERVKELTALHQVSALMLDPARPRAACLREIARTLPPAMQFPEVATASVRYGDGTFEAEGHRASPWMLTAPFQTADGTTGELAVAYQEERAFLAEESALLASVATIVCSALDRELVAAELGDTNALLNLALSTTGMAVWEWNLSNGLVRWSEQLSAMTGIDGPAVAPLAARSEATHPEDRERLWAVLRAAEAGVEPEPIEVRIRRPDGGWRPMLVRLRRDPGRPTRVIAALADVSARHALEEGLRHAQKVEALGQVAAGVAHDFNNLLSVILSGVDYLRSEMPDDHPWREVVVDLDSAASQAVALTRQLLVFSRKSEFRPAAIDVTALVAELESVLGRLAGRGVAIRTEYGRAVGTVWADRTQLEQVLMNLVVNARDAMSGEGVITVRTAHEDGSVVLSVCDSGPGVPPALRTRIFEPFFTTKKPGEGTGLGLALVASVARQWRGRVEVQGEAGEGATFRLVLPRL